MATETEPGSSLTAAQRAALDFIVAGRWAWSRVDALVNDKGVERDTLESLVAMDWAVYWVLPRGNAITFTVWGAYCFGVEIVEHGHAGRPRWAKPGSYRRQDIVRPMANTVQLKHPDFVVDKPKYRGVEYVADLETGETTRDAKLAFTLTTGNIPIEIDRRRKRSSKKKQRRAKERAKKAGVGQGKGPAGKTKAKTRSTRKGTTRRGKGAMGGGGRPAV